MGQTPRNQRGKTGCGTGHLQAEATITEWEHVWQVPQTLGVACLNPLASARGIDAQSSLHYRAARLSAAE
jgi:hypothetical protein